ncbi:hypothetical protein ACIBI9_53335 [Nonomuraea sp. NPDC050451]|uniref:hypothetical protein n=1 Tax=Nonomuraea sp. NPDC050451 TaxID=3364364 RepID=UPI0037A40DEF
MNPSIMQIGAEHLGVVQVRVLQVNENALRAVGIEADGILLQVLASPVYRRVLELDRGEHAQCGVSALSVVEDLEVFEERGSGFAGVGG